ncbi:ABC transporter substrate-binding protein [Cohnella soli]|uniref:ABC transporter substrate-binding protein n=1 Tax=Cohnella soli TaxID=425005 RepID=A0ABW0HY22_9BACL
MSKKQNGLKMATVLSLALMLTVLSGCGGANKNAAPDSSASNTDSASHESTQPSQEKEVTLQLMGWRNSDDQGLQALLEAFQAKHPTIKIQYTNASTDNYTTALKTKLLTNDGPDVFMVHPGGAEFVPLAQSGFMEDLSGSEWIGNIQEGAMKAATLDNKVYGIPVDQNLIGMFYNKKIFSDNGLTVPTTWSDLIAIADKLKANGIAPFSFALGDWPKGLPPYSLVASTVLANHPNWYQDRTAGKTSFMDWAPAYEKYQQLLENYTLDGVKGAMGVKFDSNLQLMIDGKAAMLIEGTWAYANIMQMAPSADVGLFAVNATDEPAGLVTPQGVGTVYAVYAKSDKKEAAEQFIAFLSTPESYVDPTAIPVIKGITDAPAFVKENMLTLADQGKSAPFIDVPYPPGFADKINDSLERIFALNKKPEEVMKDWDKYWDDAIQKQANSK